MLLLILQPSDYRFSNHEGWLQRPRYYWNRGTMIPILVDKQGRRVPEKGSVLPYDRLIQEERDLRSIRAKSPLLINSEYHGRLAYEFRSYRLIEGAFDDVMYGKAIFIPKLGSSVQSMDTYLESNVMDSRHWGGDVTGSPIKRPKKHDGMIPIYNLYEPVEKPNAVAGLCRYSCSTLWLHEGFARFSGSSGVPHDPATAFSTGSYGSMLAT